MKRIFKKISKSRKLILQALYSWEITKNTTLSIEHTILKIQNQNKIDAPYFKFFLHNIPKKSKILTIIINETIEKNTNTNIIENIILKMAVFEIFFYKKTPLKVIINESLELSKKFCSKNNYMLINKILNNITKGYLFYNNLLLSKC